MRGYDADVVASHWILSRDFRSPDHLLSGFCLVGVAIAKSPIRENQNGQIQQFYHGGWYRRRIKAIDCKAQYPAESHNTHQ